MKFRYGFSLARNVGSKQAHAFTVHLSSLTQYQSGGTNILRTWLPMDSYAKFHTLRPHSYDTLKKYIYQLEKQQHGHEHLFNYDLESNERSVLLTQQDATNTDSVFIPLLDRELKKIAIFYEHQEKELIDDLEDLEKSLLEQEAVGLGGYYDDFTDEDDDDDSVEESQSPERRRRSSNPQRRSSAGHPRRSTSVYIYPVSHIDKQFHALL